MYNILILTYVLILIKIIISNLNLLTLIIYMEILTLSQILGCIILAYILDDFTYVYLISIIFILLALESVIGLVFVLKYTPITGQYMLR